tara:strand:+ start:1 stop:867 length:867 start_codon:yes stop_codon:yes gene_type:complete
MSKLKHSKIRNTGLLFEILVRQVTADILDGQKNTAINIVKKFFNENTTLGKELNLYNLLINKKFNNDKQADYFINEVVKAHAKLNKSNLKREKFNLVKEIKQNFNEQKILSSKINNYKTFASIYHLFEQSNNMSPEEKTKIYFNVVEHLTTKKVVPMKSLLDEHSEDKEVRTLAVKIMMEKFNSKYSKLNQDQRSLVKEYINNVSNSNDLKEYVIKIIPKIKQQIKLQLNTIQDKVVKIKLKEAINSMNKFCKVDNNKFVKDSTVVQTLRYMELLKELKKYGQAKKSN